MKQENWLIWKGQLKSKVDPTFDDYAYFCARLLYLRQIPIGMENYHFQPFPLVHGPNQGHNPLSPLYVVLELWNLFQSHSMVDLVSLAYTINDRLPLDTLTIFEIWAFEIWTPDLREARDPSPSLWHANTVNTSALQAHRSSFGRRRSSVKASSRVTVRKLWTAISRVRSVAETRSQRQIGT